MGYVFLTSEPMILLLLTLITVILIVLGRKIEAPILPMVAVVYSVGLLVYHSICINKVDETVISQIYFSIAFDLILLFLGFISYLWIDDIAAKSRNQKSYSDALSWFWDKI